MVLAGATYVVVRPSPINNTADNHTIAATVFPIADITRVIAGDRWHVVQVLPPGASPHTFELTPKEVKSLASAQGVFAIGVIDDWINEATVSLNIPKYTTYQGINLTSDPEGAFDPHYWLTIPNAKIMAGNIADKLSQMDPMGAEGYRQRLSAYNVELDQLDAAMRQQFAGLDNKKLITFHDSWNYFAAEYGFTIAAVFEASPGKEPVPQYVKMIYDTARADNIPAIFSEPTLPTSTLEPFVKDLGIKMYNLDPEGGVAGVDTYLAMMRYNTDILVQALK